jgi:putative spermidine/putrescine transport system permease protein
VGRRRAIILDWTIWIGIRGMIGLTLIYLVLPILTILPISFTSSKLLVLPTPGWSMRWYEELLRNPIWLSGLKHSLIVGFAATFLATTAGTLAALGLARWNSPWKGVVLALVLSPMIIPIVIIAVGMFFFFSLLGLTSSYLGLVLGHTVIGLPFVVVTVTASLQVFDRRLQQAAASLGAPPFRVFWAITLPLILPGVLSGAIFAFATSFDDIVLALFIGNPSQRTLPREIFSGVRENISPAIAAIAIVLIAISILFMLSIEMLRRRSERLLGQHGAAVSAGAYE